MGDENQGATATKTTAPVRNWTDEEKDVVWDQALRAKMEGLPLTEAFRRCARLLPHRSEAAIGMLYYNVLRKEREEPISPPRKAARSLQWTQRSWKPFRAYPSTCKNSTSASVLWKTV